MRRGQKLDKVELQVQMDAFLLHQLNQFADRWEILDWLAIFTAEWLPYIAAVLLFGIFIYEGHFKRVTFFKAGFSIIVALVARFPLIWLIQLFINRPRPFVVDQKVVNILSYNSTNSFPSAHATFFFALAVYLFLLDKKLGILMVAVTVLMGIARVFVGVHWPSDILAGAFLGIFAVLLFFTAANRLFASRLKT